MAVITKEQKYNSIKAQTEEGVTVVLAQEQVTTKTFYNVQELNARISMIGLFETLAKVCKTSRDTEVMGKLLDSANNNNEVFIPNITKFSTASGISIASLKRLLTRAEEHDLIYKIDTGHFLVNPYILISKGLTSGGYAAQETAQVRWREVTGLITQAQIDKLINLTLHLNLTTGLNATEFNLSVSDYFASNGTITDKQKTSLLKKYTQRL